MFLHQMTLNHIIAFSHVLPGKNTMTWHRQVTWKKAPNHHLHVVVKLQQNLGFFIMTEFLIVCRAYIQKSHAFLNTIFFVFQPHFRECTYNKNDQGFGLNSFISFFTMKRNREWWNNRRWWLQDFFTVGIQVYRVVIFFKGIVIEIIRKISSTRFDFMRNIMVQPKLEV